MNLVQANAFFCKSYACTRIIEKNVHEIKLCCNVVIEAHGRRLIQKIINPSKMLTFVNLMYS